MNKPAGAQRALLMRSVKSAFALLLTKSNRTSAVQLKENHMKGDDN